MFILPQFYYSVTQRQFPHEINSVNAILIFHDVLQGISVIVVEGPFSMHYTNVFISLCFL